MLESLQKDQQTRWQRGERVRVSYYLEKMPTLASSLEVLSSLICSELVLRCTAGEPIDIEEYLQQFPQCGDAIRRQARTLGIVNHESDFDPTPPGSRDKDDPLLATIQLAPATKDPFETVSKSPDGRARLDDTPRPNTFKPAQVVGVDKSDPNLDTVAPPAGATDDPSLATLAFAPAIKDLFETVASVPDRGALLDHDAEQNSFPTVPGFEILAELGRGGMGVVYKARQIAANRLVALKLVRNELLDTLPLASRKSTLDRFRNEAQAAARLQHDNLVSVYEVGEVPSQRPGASRIMYYAMRLVQGKSLYDIVRDGPLDNRRAVTYMAPVARALQFAHNQGILHRDLKPHNILIEESTERPLVADFGLAKFTEGQESLTYAGEVMGTPSYMSPEQATDAANVTASADLYSLGATLYHLLTGRPPFQSASLADTIRQIIEKPPVAPRQLNPAIDRDLETICLKTLEKDPARRYARCSDLAEDLQRYLDGRPIIARPVGPFEKMWRWGRRNPVLAILIGSAILLSLATIASIVIGYRNTTAALAESESRLDRALQVVDELFTRVSEDELLNEPGMQSLRKDLLEKALKHYQYFLTETGGNEKIGDEVAAAHFRVGLISQVLGENKTAESELLLALKMQEQLLAPDQTDRFRLKSLADSCNALGSLFSTGRRYDESAKMFQRSTEIRTELVRLDQTNVEYQRLQSNSLMNLGLTKVQNGKSAEGVRNMQEAQELREKLIQSNPSMEKLRRDLAMGWYSLGKTEMGQAKLDVAAGHYKAAIDEFRTLLKQNSRSLTNRYYLGVSLRLLGGVLAELDQPTEALTAFEDATKAMETLAMGNPDVAAYGEELAVLAMNRGGIYLALGQLENAKSAWSQALSLSRELQSRNTTNPSLMGDVAACLGSLGDIERELGDIPAAMKLFQEAKEVLAQALRLDPENEWFKGQLEKNEQDLQILHSRN